MYEVSCTSVAAVDEVPLDGELVRARQALWVEAVVALDERLWYVQETEVPRWSCKVLQCDRWSGARRGCGEELPVYKH